MNDRKRSLRASSGNAAETKKRRSSAGKETGTAFEEHVSGIGVGTLFSVWGPSSQQH